jgi:hypothetical protein
MDLSRIDFEALHSQFRESNHKNTDREVLKAAIPAGFRPFRAYHCAHL